jgi:RimJ/RimL family protein N-acetyltransferase
MTLLVRQLTPDDWEMLREIRLAALLDSPAAFLTTHAEAARNDEAQWRARTTSAAMFVAWMDEKPAGLCGTFAADAPDRHRVLVAMWVAPAARGTGVADALIEAALAHGAAAGTPSMVLEVAPGNLRAERVYARHGFAVTDEAPEIPGGLTMRRILP